MNHRQSGFTLIELMIVVAIIGVLSMIAYPSYQEYVLRGKLAEATAGLAELRVKAEQYFADRRTYVGFTCPSPSQVRYFSFSCSDGDNPLTANTYLLQATGVVSEGMSGFSYTVNQSNIRTSSISRWGQNSSVCWIVRKDGSC